MEIFTEQVFSGISCFCLFVCLLAFFSSEPLKKKFGLKKQNLLNLCHMRMTFSAKEVRKFRALYFHFIICFHSKFKEIRGKLSEKIELIMPSQF